MAYKNKNKQKAHIATLKQIGWRKSERDRKILTEKVRELTYMGMSTKEAHDLIERRSRYGK